MADGRATIYRWECKCCEGGGCIAHGPEEPFWCLYDFDFMEFNWKIAPSQQPNEIDEEPPND